MKDRRQTAADSRQQTAGSSSQTARGAAPVSLVQTKTPPRSVHHPRVMASMPELGFTPDMEPLGDIGKPLRSSSSALRRAPVRDAGLWGKSRGGGEAGVSHWSEVGEVRMTGSGPVRVRVVCVCACGRACVRVCGHTRTRINGEKEPRSACKGATGRAAVWVMVTKGEGRTFQDQAQPTHPTTYLARLFATC